MSIQDIIGQEKQKELIRKSKQKQDKHLKKLFYKDCYKMWKDYKKVESPYFWWLTDILNYRPFLKDYYVYWIFLDAPKEYLKDSLIYTKWDFKFCIRKLTFKIKHKSNPNDEWVYL